MSWITTLGSTPLSIWNPDSSCRGMGTFVSEYIPSHPMYPSPMMYLDTTTSVVLSLAAAAPFNGTLDQNLAVAYISVFLLIYFMTAPDGQPPLAIVLNTTTFIGGASVPLGLIILGSALARMEIPGGRLPLGAVGTHSSGAVGCQQQRTTIRVHSTSHDASFLSCVPTATTQVVLTQVYSGNISVFLISQYILMFITM
ncbi:hypothetical protein V8E55_008731 [Tylopilus felleus]